MDKPNKTDNVEQPAETVDTEGGLTAEKPRSRRRKTSIAHIATVCGSVYTGGKTAKDIKKQAEQSAITADDAEIIEIPEPGHCYMPCAHRLRRTAAVLQSEIKKA